MPRIDGLTSPRWRPPDGARVTVAIRVIRFMRLIRRIVALHLWTLGCAAALCMAPVTAFLRRSAVQSARRRVMRIWAHGAGRIIGMRVSVNGTIPRAPFVLVCNHLSYVDIVLLAGELGCTFVAKREVRHWVGWGTLARLGGTIFVDRQRVKDTVRVISEIRRRTAAGDGVVLFPEGTSTSGDRVLPMKSALLQCAVGDEAPVQYAAISYATPKGERPAESAVCWWGDMTFGRHFLDLLQMEGFKATVSFGDSALRSTDRKKLARDLHRAVAKQLTLVE